MESSASFPEIDATGLLKMRENTQNNNTQRSRKTWIKVFDLRRAGRSEARKLEEIPEQELNDVNSSDCQIRLGLRIRPSWKSSEFFPSNYFQIGQHVVLLHILITY